MRIGLARFTGGNPIASWRVGVNLAHGLSESVAFREGGGKRSVQV